MRYENKRTQQYMDVLVEAERKYMTKLTSVMAPVMIDAFYDLFQEAKKTSQGRKVLLQYQALLKEVKNWNNTIVKQHTDAIIKSCSMFPNLLAAVFVILVKIMSAVRISSDSKKLNIKLPTNDVFVHSCYMATAASLYEDPYVMVDDITDIARRANLHARITKAVREVVEDFVPIQQILDTYIPSFTGGELDMNGPSEAETPAIDPEPEPEPMPVATPETEPAGEEEPSALEEAVENATSPGETPMTEEVKSVPVTTPATPATAPVHQETLFDDAPEKK
jgi:hypothetical protein